MPIVKNLKWTRIDLIFQTLCRRKNSTSSALKWSYLMGPSDKQFLDLTIGKLAQRAADQFGDTEAIVSCEQNIRKTYDQLNSDCEKLAAGFVALGLERGDRLGIWDPNSYEWCVTQYAAGKAGLILVNINPSYRANELKYCLNKVSLKAIVCAQKFKTSNYYAILEEIAPELSMSQPGQLISREIPNLKSVIFIGSEKLKGTFSFDEIFNAGGTEAIRRIQELDKVIQFDEPCNIQFTSGTTGLQKAAILSHHSIINNAYFMGDRAGFDKGTRICSPVPLYHSFGSVAGTLSSALFGSTLLIPSAGFSPKNIINCFENEKPHFCYGTPTMYVDILNEFRKRPVDMSCMYSGFMGAAPCPEQLVNDIISELNMKHFITLYGMTETSPATLQCFPKDDKSVKMTTVGYPLPHTEVKVVDIDGRIAPVGTPGELMTRGYCNFLGYWDDEERTAEMIGRDRWLRTGDLATINERGYGQIIGRIKDVVIRGGENIYPTEIENFYMRHPGIIDAQVIGVPDCRMGEELVMWIRIVDGSKLDQKSLKSWSKGKIAPYKVPKFVMIKDEFPATVTGKIQKFKMKEITMEELNISQ